MHSYSVEVKNNGDSRFTAISADHTLMLDTEGGGMWPLDALLAALGGCMGFYVRLYCRKNAIALDGFTVCLASELTKERPYRLAEITVTIDFKDASLDGKTKEAIAAFVRQCPVHNTLAMKPDVKLQVR
jgi:uncharacterized OsmC-like protein